MERTKIILVTSCKGGVGKSTITANLGLALARSGHRTLLVDCDFGNRCLDLILGSENEMIYDISDVCEGRAEINEAAVTDRRSSNLLSIAAPYLAPEQHDFSVPDREVFRSKLFAAGESMNLDYILIDTPGALGAPLELAASAADRALIVSTHHPTALRAADGTASALSSLGITECSMIINSFDPDSVLHGNRAGVIEMIDRAALGIIGVIPYDPVFAIGGEHGELVYQLKCRNVIAAFNNIAARLSGETVPLFTGFKGIKRKKLLKR